LPGTLQLPPDQPPFRVVSVRASVSASLNTLFAAS
jgi:hypothetical protein